MINEADIRYLTPTWKWFKSSDYVELLKEGSEVIRKYGKRNKILFSGLANSDSKFVDSIFNIGVSQYFDIMNVHKYNHKNSEPEDLISYFQRLHDKLEKYSIKKPVWLTECGCSTAEGWASESVHANRLPRIFLISYACGIDKVFWYKSRSREIDPSDKEDYFGLWHKDYTLKPAYYAYKTLIKMCPSKSTRPKLERNGKIYTATWKKPDGKSVWAFWTSKSKESITLNIKGKFKAFDLGGDDIHHLNNVFEVTPSIVYIVGARDVQIAN